MGVELDHIAVPSRNKNASARLLAEILGVRWEPSAEDEPQSPARRVEWISGELSEDGWRQYRAQRASVYVNDCLTLDFVSPREGATANHCCLRVADADFDAVLERIKKAGLKFSSSGVGEPDFRINTRLGGKGVYSTEPDGRI